MKVLFVCKWNQGRSQIAEALFNKYTSKHTAFSAGTHANEFPGVTLSECAPLVVRVMKELNIDISEKTTKKLTQELVNKADKIVVMSKQNELPEYIKHSDNVIYWNVDDPEGNGYDFHVSMRDQIYKLIKGLLSTLE